MLELVKILSGVAVFFLAWPFVLHFAWKWNKFITRWLERRSERHRGQENITSGGVSEQGRWGCDR